MRYLNGLLLGSLLVFGNPELTCFGANCQEKQLIPLNVGHHVVIGLGMGITDAIVTTPAYYFKNGLQLRQQARFEGAQLPSMSLNPYKWYTGTMANALGLIAVAQCQNLSFEMIKRDISSWIAAPVSGAIAAPLACAADFSLRHVQNKPNKTEKHIKNESALKMVHNLYTQYGLQCFARGLGVTIARDVPFSMGYLVAIPFCREVIEKNIENKIAKNTAIIGSGLGIGLFITALTHPCDAIAGVLQNDPGKKIYKNTLDAGRVIYQSHGVKGFFSGVVPRTGVVSLSILALEEAKNKLSDILIEKMG